MTTQPHPDVMRLLSTIDPVEHPGRLLASWGDDAVAFACEVALGDHPSLGLRARRACATLVSACEHPEADATMDVLLTDADRSVVVRTVRWIARRKLDAKTPALARLLRAPALDAIVEEELLRALRAIDSDDARAVIAERDRSRADARRA